MLPFSWYMLKVIICSGILFAYYWLFLRNKIFHGYNRFYLLASMMLSLLLPLLKINFWQPAAQQSQAIRVLQAVSVGDEYMSNMIVTAQKNNWSIEQLYSMAYWLVCGIFFFVMLRTLFLIRTLLKKYPVQQIDDVSFVNTQHDSTPFSFLKYIFWNSSIDLDTTTGRQIFKHEVAHIQEKHTHDKLFVNIILIFCWCNPFFWVYRKELNMIHEFIADKKAVEDSDTAAFAAMILQAAYPKHRFELVNNFFYSPIKRRLLMLSKNKNPKVNYIGRIMVLPLLVLVFAAFTFKTKSNTHIYQGKKITVVIDAGHGGQDAGATSADGILEKDLTLAIAKKVKELNNNTAVEIVLVRDADVYMNPQQKVAFAKSKNADIVISLHIDNGPKESANKHSGISLWVAKDEFTNAAKSKVLASAILTEFSNNYELPVISPINQRQAGVYILKGNTCPSVLIEAGFINNEKDLAYLKSNAAKETIAKNVLLAIEKFASSNSFIAGKVVKEEANTPAYPVLKDTVPAKVITGVNPDAPAPLYIVNGKETDKNIALAIKPEDVQDVRIIKNTVALQVYGEKGKNGVVIINTKPGVSSPGSWTAGSMTVHGTDISKTLGKNPLLIIDNIEYRGKTLDEITAMTGVKRFENIDIYGSEEAMKTYGEKAKDGVIIAYTTKQKLPLTELSAENDLMPFVKADSSNLSALKIKLQRQQELSARAIYEQRVVVGIKQDNQEIQNQKLALEKLNKERATLLEEKVVVGKKITEQEMQNRKVQLEKQYTEVQLASMYHANAEQKKSEVIEVQGKPISPVFTKVEQNPQFTGGPEAWRKFLQANLKVNTPVDNGAKAGIYKVILKFIVNADGSLSDITCESDPGYGICAEAIRFIKTTPRWQPALQNGQKVNAFLKQPITFVVEE